MPKISLEDVKSMIIQEVRTGVAYHGDEHHEEFDFRLAPYETFINSMNGLVDKFKNDVTNDDLSSYELQFLRNDLLERAQDALSYAVQLVDMKIKGLDNPQDEEF
tara:strand:+ start:717 stop:1031 length:315 start_codon:yes stop_codon:yes gene_type:complete